SVEELGRVIVSRQPRPPVADAGAHEILDAHLARETQVLFQLRGILVLSEAGVDTAQGETVLLQEPPHLRRGPLPGEIAGLDPCITRLGGSAEHSLEIVAVATPKYDQLNPDLWLSHRFLPHKNWNGQSAPRVLRAAPYSVKLNI